MLFHKMRTIIALQAFVILICIQPGKAQECGVNGDCDSHERWYVGLFFFLFSFDFQIRELTTFLLFIQPHMER